MSVLLETGDAVQVVAPENVVERGDLVRIAQAAEALGMLPHELKGLVSSLCYEYLTEVRDGRVEDNSAHFHFSNGAALRSLHWRADESPQGLALSLSLFAAYAYSDEAEGPNALSYAQGRCPVHQEGVSCPTASGSLGWPECRMAGFRSSDLETLAAIIDLLRVGAQQVVGAHADATLFVDLGSGDGRVVDAVVHSLGWRAVGVELMEELVVQSSAARAALPEELAARMRFMKANMEDVDLGQADVLFLYFPQGVLRYVVRNLLPSSGLKVGALVLVEDAPDEFRGASGRAVGLGHLKCSRPGSGRHGPCLDLFRWLRPDPVPPERATGRCPLLPLWSP